MSSASNTREEHLKRISEMQKQLTLKDKQNSQLATKHSEDIKEKDCACVGLRDQVEKLRSTIGTKNQESESKDCTISGIKRDREKTETNLKECQRELVASCAHAVRIVLNLIVCWLYIHSRLHN